MQIAIIYVESKLKTFKIYLLAVAISFFSIASLCLLLKQPLIFLPAQYKLSDFLSLLILLSLLNFGLVFLVLVPLRVLNEKFFHIVKPTGVSGYFCLISLATLFFATLAFGYLESSITYSFVPTPFYYYNFSNNSWIYLVCAFSTVCITSFLFGKRRVS